MAKNNTATAQLNEGQQKIVDNIRAFLTENTFVAFGPEQIYVECFGIGAFARDWRRAAGLVAENLNKRQMRFDGAGDDQAATA